MVYSQGTARDTRRSRERDGSDNKYHNRPLVIHHIPWASLSEQAVEVSPEHTQDVVAIEEMCELHDLNVLVPISPLTALRER
jgi:hypothetical protein